MTSDSASLPQNSAELPIGEQVIARIKTVYDPEIPVNLYDLGLIYKIDIQDNASGKQDILVDMTLTTPNCPIADYMPILVQRAIEAIDGIGKVTVNLVWDPPWDMSRMSDEARIALDMF